MQKITDHLEEVKDKKVLVRCNFDVPIEDGVVQDTTRIEDAISTVKTLRENNCTVIMIAHHGRPKGSYQESMSLSPVAKILEELLNQPVRLLEYKEDLSEVEHPQDGLALLENLRFWGGEEANDQVFAQKLSDLGEVYVNQAFANCHRQHASMVLLPKLLPAYAGGNLANEVEILTKSRNHPDKPLAVVIGGAKLETKEPLVDVFADVADNILVGGKVALDLKQKNAVLPENVTVAELIENGRDITLESAEHFAKIIQQAATVIWNGTMGVFEEEEYQAGTKIVAEAIHTTPAFTVVGGGDTETALTELQLEEHINFISTGGGAMLTFLSEGTLVALEALE